MTPHIQTQSEKDNDALQVERIEAQTDAAIAYDHAAHGCPFADRDEVCSVCDTPDNIANETLAFFGGIQ